MKYKELIGKKINVGLNGQTVNSYKITKMLSTHRGMGNRGRIYECHVDWENKDMAEAPLIMDFDAQTLDELLTGTSICPFMPNLYYKLDDNE